MSLIPIPSRIAAAEHELSDLLAYPQERLATIIKEVGFRCDLCSRCCTRAFNGHVFLLDCDTTRAMEIDPESVEPAPYPEFCDQQGTFYVSGYALGQEMMIAAPATFLRTTAAGYMTSDFPSVACTYMLHREPDEQGTIDWRQISGLDQHGEYNTEISEDICEDAAAETREYEIACIRQELSFLEYIQDYFSKNRLRHVQKVYDDRMRAFARGEEIRVMVFYNGRLEEHRVRSP